MDHFTISDLAAFSGVKAHTIRIWEQRYKALTPHRSAGSTRYYDNNQLRRLLNIVSVMDSDYKLMELCSMPDDQLFELVMKSAPGPEGQDGYYIAQLIAAGLSYNELYFEKFFGSCLLRYGLKNTYLKVIYPMLERIGVLWAGNSIPPATEHFISNLLRQKLFTAIDSLPPVEEKAECWLLFLPENEFHELGLLMANYLIRYSGKKTVYLGPNVPEGSLSAAISMINPDNLLLFFVHRQLNEEIKQFLDKLNKQFTGKRICVSTTSKISFPVKTSGQFVWLDSIEKLEQVLQ